MTFATLVVLHCMKIYENKKVLLRERKRHTTHRVASTRCVSGPGGTQSQVWGGGFLVPGLEGVPHPRSGGYPVPGQEGYPIPGLGGYPVPCAGGTPGIPLPRPGMGYPPTWTWDGVPPPPASVNRLKILPHVILRMRAVITTQGHLPL